MKHIVLAVGLACATAPTALAQVAQSTAAPSVPPSWYVENLTGPEVRDAIATGRASAIIYTGSTEQNGPIWRPGARLHRAQGANPVDQIRRLRTGGPVTAAGLRHPCS